MVKSIRHFVSYFVLVGAFVFGLLDKDDSLFSWLLHGLCMWPMLWVVLTGISRIEEETDRKAYLRSLKDEII